MKGDHDRLNVQGQPPRGAKVILKGDHDHVNVQSRSPSPDHAAWLPLRLVRRVGGSPLLHEQQPALLALLNLGGRGRDESPVADSNR